MFSNLFMFAVFILGSCCEHKVITLCICFTLEALRLRCVTFLEGFYCDTYVGSVEIHYQFYL